MQARIVDECAFCRNGLLHIKRDIKSKRLLLICDDCDSEWLDPEAALRGDDPITEDLYPLEEVTFEELKNKGWDKYLKKGLV